MNLAPSSEDHRRRVAAEVLELGETLFDAVLDAAADPARAAEGEPLPEAELRTAAEEFFQALRALLMLDAPSAPQADAGQVQEGG